MTLQHKIFQSRINGSKLNEQIPVGGDDLGGVNVSNTPQASLRGFGSKLPRSNIANTTRNLRGAFGEVPPLEPTQKWQNAFNKWISGGDTIGGVPKWVGWPPDMGETGSQSEGDYSNYGELTYEEYIQWWSFLNWFVGSDANADGVPDEGTPYDTYMQSMGLDILGGPEGLYDNFYTIMQMAANGDAYAINFLLGNPLTVGDHGQNPWYGESDNDWQIHMFFGQIFWGRDYQGNDGYWEWWHEHQ